MPAEAFVRARLGWFELQRRVAVIPPGELPGKALRLIGRRLRTWSEGAWRLAFGLRNLLTRSKPVVVRIGKISFLMVPSGAVAFDLWSRRRIERHELSFILRWMRSEGAFLDVGANAGLFSLAAAAARSNRPETIYAFEPCEETASLLETNLRLNSFNGVEIAHLALSDREGTGWLQINARYKDGLNTLGRPSHSDSEIVGQQAVQVTTLDSFLTSRGIGRVDLMKVDVEGAELMVFRGARDLLSRRDAPLLLYEGYRWCTAGFSYHPVEIAWQLEEHGYELFVLDQRTGCARRRLPGESHDAMMVAVKPSDPRYEALVGERPQ